MIDSGVSSRDFPHFNHPIESYDFTKDSDSVDYQDHGTSTLSVSILHHSNSQILGSTHPKCPGVLPLSHLISLKVVDSVGGFSVSLRYPSDISTASLLNALNRTATLPCPIVVFSIGGRDLNFPAISQSIDQLATSHHKLIFAAAGNDGPPRGSVLSPADHPAVISVGALSNQNTPLVSASRGFRTHFAQKLLPEFWTAGYKIPVLNPAGKCHEVSGSSIAAPLFAGFAALTMEKESRESGKTGETGKTGGWMSLGALRCRLHRSCLFPSVLRVPSEEFPYFGSGLLALFVAITAQNAGERSSASDRDGVYDPRERFGAGGEPLRLGGVSG